MSTIRALATSVCLLFAACFPDMTPGKTVLDTEDVRDTRFELFNYGSAYAEVPDLLTATSGLYTDTICIATNIIAIGTNKTGGLTIGFPGRPALYDSLLFLPPDTIIHGKKITIDTTYPFRYP
jgi:hypothetical protein